MEDELQVDDAVVWSDQYNGQQTGWVLALTKMFVVVVRVGELGNLAEIQALWRGDVHRV